MLRPSRPWSVSRASLRAGVLGSALLALCVAAAPARAATLVVRNNPGSGEFAAISDAMTAANPGDVIQVNAGTYYERLAWNKAVDISCVGGEVTIRGNSAESNFVIQISGTNPAGKSLHSDGSGHRIIILPASGATNQVGIQCTAGQNTAISDCDFSGFLSSSSGAGIQGTGGLVTSCTFTNCFSGGAGGALSGEGDATATLCKFVSCGAPFAGAIVGFDEVTHCDFDTCIASTNDGGALVVSGKVEHCTFLDCTAGGFGGAIAGATDVRHCDFAFCSAEGSGGAISADGVGIIFQCTYSHCTAGGSGGAIHAANAVADCTFDTCQAGVAGGAVVDVSMVTTCSFVHCGAGTNGGGVADTDTVELSSFTDCNAPNGQGGAIFDMSVTIHHSTIDDCSAMTGGGIAESAGTMEVVTVKNCTATGDGGGALWNVEGTIDRCLFAANAATNTAATKGRGGALASCGGGITNSVIIGNQAEGNGGGISNTDGFIKNCTIVGNHSDEFGGGLSGCGGSIRNCIITDNVDDDGGSNSNQVSANSSTPNFCCLPGNWSGGGSSNRTTNTPGFTTFGGFGTDPFGWNLRLTSTSVCIDKGDNLTLIVKDFDGNGRPAGPASKWDIGAFERQ